ncbi:hypothetical protein CFC21_030454 [Triticum aestivum]|uniref:Uncharacterized protein n=2 Tax=Triticum aestivum TaxID=4565 RepID=A0A9R1EUC3_WHEAT|nr:hypothetical protein CFC21_030454 [Triticum aestivum]
MQNKFQTKNMCFLLFTQLNQIWVFKFQVNRSRAVLPDEQEQSSNSRTLIIFSTGSRGATPYGTFFLLTSRSSGGSTGRRAAAAPAVGEKQPHGRAGRGEAAARARAKD